MGLTKISPDCQNWESVPGLPNTQRVRESPMLSKLLRRDLTFCSPHHAVWLSLGNLCLHVQLHLEPWGTTPAGVRAKILRLLRKRRGIQTPWFLSSHTSCHFLGVQFVLTATTGTKWQMIEIFQGSLESVSPGQLREGPCHVIFTAPKQKHGCP